MYSNAIKMAVEIILDINDLQRQKVRGENQESNHRIFYLTLKLSSFIHMWIFAFLSSTLLFKTETFTRRADLPSYDP